MTQKISDAQLNKLLESHERNLNLIANLLDYHLPDRKTYDGEVTQRLLETKNLVTHSQVKQHIAYNVANWGQDFRSIMSLEPTTYDLRVPLESDYKDTPKGYQEALGIYRATYKKFHIEKCKLIREALKTIPFAAKTFQELFTPIQEFTINQSTNNHSLKHYVFASPVSPELFTDHLAESLGLCDFSDCVRNPLKRIEKKSDPKVLAALRLIYLGLKNVGYRNGGRLYKFTKVESIDKETNKLLEKYNKECVGKIVMINFTGKVDSIFDEYEGVEVRRKRIAIFQTLNSAKRALEEIDKSYMAESHILMKISERVERLGEMLCTWKRETLESDKDEIKKIVIKECDDILSLLKNSINKYKIEIKELLEETSQAQKVRNNPYAYILKLSAALKRIDKRFSETNAIIMHETSNKRWIKDLIQNIEFKFDSVNKKVDYWKTCLKHCRILRNEEIEDMLFTFTYTINNLSQIEELPYCQIANNLQNAFDRMKSIFEYKGSIKDVISELDYMKFNLFLEKNILRKLHKALKPKRMFVFIHNDINMTLSELNKAIEQADVSEKYIEFYKKLSEAISNILEKFNKVDNDNNKLTEFLRNSAKDILNMIYDKINE